MSKNEAEKSTLDLIKRLAIGLFTLVFIPVAGYLGKFYFNSLSKKDDQVYQYKDETYKKLYEKSKPEILALAPHMNCFLF